MSTLAEFMILSRGDNRPPMLEKHVYDSWKSRMELYMQNKEHGRMILKSVEHEACSQPQSIPQIEYTVSTVNQQTHLAEIPQIDSGLPVPVFKQGDDPIDAINKMMSFLYTVVTSRFLTTNNQLSGNNSGQQRVVKCFNCQGKGHMARQCPKPRRKRDATWFRDKVLLVEAQGYCKILNEEELELLADPGVAEGPVTHTIITHNAAYQDDLDAYDYDFDDFSTGKAIRPMLYDGSVIAKKTNVISVVDSEETLMLEEESRSKMILKQSDPMVLEKKVNIKPINYAGLNQLSKDFGKRFVPQQELSVEQAFQLQTSLPNTEQSASLPINIEAPRELLKIMPDALTEGEWGFEYTKAVFLNEIILFLKTSKDIFNVFDKDLLNEITKVQRVFIQIEAAVQQFHVDKQCFEIQKKQFLIENDRLLDQITSQDIINIFVNSLLDINTFVNMNSSVVVNDYVNYVEMCNKCLKLKAGLIKRHNMVEKMKQTDGEAMINSIKNGDQPLPRVTQVSIAGTTSTEQPPLKDKSMWSDQEKIVQKIDRLARSLLIPGLPNDICSLIDSNKNAKDLWDALARHMLGSEYG
nr:hypothetical protein [Tanacetum cinerariifolium]